MTFIRLWAILTALILFSSIGLEAATHRHRHRRVVHRTYVKTRSHKKSAAIVGGSAATGAAIGALAGGGKGAAIGALAGGAGGFAYDRHTAKKRVE